MSPDPDTRPARSPAPIAWVDGRVVPATEATVPLLDDGFLRGDAVFETMLVRHGRTHARDAHLARMRDSARALGLRLPLLKRPIEDLLAAWGATEGALKVIVTRTGTVRGLLMAPDRPSSVSLHVVDIPWRTAISGTKTLSYAANQWAERQAREQHADQALITTDGTVMELPTAAIGWITAGRVHTPDPAALPILDSVTVRAITAVTEVAYGSYPLDDLLGADEVFVASATRPVLPVHAVGHTEFPADGAATRDLQAALAAHIEATLD
ncbi:MAG TPA: aminotransferase class IV [Nitriliruptorales bacterium]